jgi:hypothetical protein
MAGLEQRLLDTELALLEALTSLEAQGAVQEVSPSIAEAFKVHNAISSKAAKMAEWVDLPLSSVRDRERWRRSKAVSTGRAPARVEHHHLGAQLQPPPQVKNFRTSSSASLDETGGLVSRHTTGYNFDTVDEAPMNPLESAGSSRAAHLERHQSHRFF